MKNVILSDKTMALVYKMQAEAITSVKLSNTSKLGVKSWSLQALNTCPASLDANGDLVAACKGCYATSGNYRFSNVRAPREFNKQAWKNESFVNDFVIELHKERFFRWFDSGDMYSLQLAEKIYQIMQLTPHVKHWLPTRMYKFKKFHSVIKKMQALDNVVVRLSSDHIDGTKVDSIYNQVSDTNSVIIPSDAVNDYAEGFICRAYRQEGKCLNCTACYDKNIKTIAYVGHGKAMVKNQKLITIENIQ